jgi:hypothetical protein
MAVFTPCLSLERTQSGQMAHAISVEVRHNARPGAP